MPEEISPTIETSQPVTETKTTNRPKIVLAAVLGFGLLIGAAYAGYWYSTKQLKNPAQVSTPTLEITSTPMPTVAPAPAEDENESAPIVDPLLTKYKIQLSHPSQFEYEERGESLRFWLDSTRDSNAPYLDLTLHTNQEYNARKWLFEYQIDIEKEKDKDFVKFDGVVIDETRAARAAMAKTYFSDPRTFFYIPSGEQLYVLETNTAWAEIIDEQGKEFNPHFTFEAEQGYNQVEQVLDDLKFLVRPEANRLPMSSVHLYKKPQEVIKTLKLAIVYFVPSDKENDYDSKWQEHFMDDFSEVKGFYETEFNHSLNIEYEFISDVIVGENDSNYYISEKAPVPLDYGTRTPTNAERLAPTDSMLATIEPEIKAVLADRKGSGYVANLGRVVGGQLNVLVMDGEIDPTIPHFGPPYARGGKTILLMINKINRHYEGAQLLVHELAHAFEIPDCYSFGDYVNETCSMLYNSKEQHFGSIMSGWASWGFETWYLPDEIWERVVNH